MDDVWNTYALSMDLNHLRAFVGVAEEGGFCKAATRLGVAQPSISQQVRRLEKHLGNALFDRLGRQTVLTEAGRALLPRAKAILADVREIESGFGLETGDRQSPGRLVVGAIPTIAPYVLPIVIRTMLRPRDQKSPPEVVIREDVTDRLAPAVADAEVEVALVSAPVADERIEIEHIADEPFVVAVAKGHPWARRSVVSLGALHDEELIVLHEEHCFGRQLAAVCAGTRVSPRVRSATASLRTALELVAAGVGVTVIPAMCAAGSAGIGCEFVAIKGATGRDVSLAWRRGRSRSAQARRFAEEARATITRLLSGV